MKALPMPLLCIEGTANFPYQILLVSFHLQYRNACIFHTVTIVFLKPYVFQFQVHSTGGEWCYVEDRHANKGYVPITYLKAYQQPPQQSTAENNTTNNTTTNTITTTAQLEKVNEEES